MTINIAITDSPDMAALAKLHAASFAKGWDDAMMREVFAIAGTKAFVADRCRGFAIVRHLGGEAEILTLAVEDASRRQGIGRALVGSMRAWAEERQIKTIFLEVRESNSAAQALYRTGGFVMISRRKNYYRNADGASEDAVVMRWRPN